MPSKGIASTPAVTPPHPPTPGMASSPADLSRSAYLRPRTNIVLQFHGKRLPAEVSAAAREKDKEGLSQWFKAGKNTSIYFAGDITSAIPGGTCIVSRAPAGSQRLCNDFNRFTKNRTDLEYIQEKANYMFFDHEGNFEAAPHSLPKKLAHVWDETIRPYGAEAPSRVPRVKNNECVPNLLLTDDSPDDGANGMYECEHGLAKKISRKLPLFYNRALKKAYGITTLEKEVRFCEKKFSGHDLHIYVMTCLGSSDLDNKNNPLPFLRPSKATAIHQEYARRVGNDSGTLTEAEVACDSWAEKILENSRLDDEIRKLDLNEANVRPLSKYLSSRTEDETNWIPSPKTGAGEINVHLTKKQGGRKRKGLRLKKKSKRHMSKDIEPLRRRRKRRLTRRRAS